MTQRQVPIKRLNEYTESKSEKIIFKLRKQEWQKWLQKDFEASGEDGGALWTIPGREREQHEQKAQCGACKQNSFGLSESWSPTVLVEGSWGQVTRGCVEDSLE